MREHHPPGAHARECLAPATVMLPAVNELRVQNGRDVVQEDAIAGATDVDPSLDSAEGGEGGDRIVAVDAQVACEVVSGPERNADEWKVALDRDRGDCREGPVAAGNAERLRVRRSRELGGVVVVAEDVDIEAHAACSGPKLLRGPPGIPRTRVHQEETRHRRTRIWVWRALKLSRSAHGAVRHLCRHLAVMSERGLHQIEDDLSDTWLEDWAGAGVAEIEAYLAKHAAFLSFLDSQES